MYPGDHGFHASLGAARPRPRARTGWLREPSWLSIRSPVKAPLVGAHPYSRMTLDPRPPICNPFAALDVMLVAGQ